MKFWEETDQAATREERWFIFNNLHLLLIQYLTQISAPRSESNIFAMRIKSTYKTSFRNWQNLADSVKSR